MRHLKSSDLKKTLTRINRKGYKAYKDLKGAYDFGDYLLYIDHVQGDPFASPSRLRVRVNQDVAGFPLDTYSNRSREIALRDYLSRVFYRNIGRFSEGSRGSGKSGLISIDRPGQEILQRSSVLINKEFVEVRFFLGLPARGRSIAGDQAEEMFFKELPAIVRHSLIFRKLDSASLYEHIHTAEDADYLRELLTDLGIVSFVADGSILPRASGTDKRPLKDKKVVPFVCPETLRIEVQLPNRGKVSGMGIHRGITLIVGGGYHGKSTLLDAIMLGIYNHVPGDGRELVVTDPKTVKIRAEDGRRIEKVNISSFISNLPFGQDTVAFCTDNASGSTSQAANIMEALEIGAKVLLIDEDTSATNFMIRDHRMQELVSKDREPITPFIDKARQLYKEYGVSTVLVIGGSGDYFDIADHVICMTEYRPYDFTERAREIAHKYRAERRPEGGTAFGSITERIPLAESLDPRRGQRDVKISTKGLHTIVFGTESVELAALEQLVDPSQTRAIGDAMSYARRYMDGKRTLREVVETVMRDIEERELDVLSPSPKGDYAYFRAFELAAAINRLRTLRMLQKRQ